MKAHSSRLAFITAITLLSAALVPEGKSSEMYRSFFQLHSGRVHL
jgi:hypothetical protein